MYWWMSVLLIYLLSRTFPNTIKKKLYKKNFLFFTFIHSNLFFIRSARLTTGNSLSWFAYRLIGDCFCLRLCYSKMSKSEKKYRSNDHISHTIRFQTRRKGIIRPKEVEQMSLIIRDFDWRWSPHLPWKPVLFLMSRVRSLLSQSILIK